VRARDELADIPVIVVTAKTLTKEDRMRLDGSAQEILSKGDFSGQELMKAVLRQVNKLLVQTE
jgi:CheY-like chemotaxis protein